MPMDCITDDFLCNIGTTLFCLEHNADVIQTLPYRFLQSNMFVVVQCPCCCLWPLFKGM